MNDLVIMKNQQAVATSLQVAKTFEKNHYHLMRDIEKLLKGLSKNGDTQQMFAKGTHVNEQNGQEYSMYYMNRDGFTLLAMGFTGQKALDFKLQYIKAFNHMEKQLTEMVKDSYMISDPVLRATKWIDEEKERQHLREENTQLQIPALVGRAVATTTQAVLVGNLANVLKTNGVDIGQNRLFTWLRKNGYLIATGKRYNMPTQKSLDLGVMTTRESVITTNHGAVPRFTTLITGKGQEYFINKFLKLKGLSVVTKEVSQ